MTHFAHLFFLKRIPSCFLRCFVATDYVAVVEQKLAHEEFASLHPGDQEAATRAFVAFTGMFGQVYNSLKVFFPSISCAAVGPWLLWLGFTVSLVRIR